MVLQEDPIVVCKLSQNSRFFPRNRARIFQFEVPIAGILALDSCSLLLSLVLAIIISLEIMKGQSKLYYFIQRRIFRRILEANQKKKMATIEMFSKSLCFYCNCCKNHQKAKP